ncbi:MAG: phosphoribosylaminoimidazole carboxylase [Planctomycetaceae bacterium]|jgi:hypothetical protein
MVSAQGNSMVDQPPHKVQSGGWFRRLINPEQPGLLLPISGAWVFCLDWLLFSSNAATLGLATPVSVALGFVLGSSGTYVMQRRFAHESFSKAALKAFVSGLLVGAPWPIGGTLLGGWVLLASGLGPGRTKSD